MLGTGNKIGLTPHRIIVATDFTPVSERAMGCARAMAKRFCATLTVTHVIDLSVATVSRDAVIGLVIDEMRHDSAENMERIMNELVTAGVHVKCKTLEAHNPARAIVDLAKELEADLIVVGTGARHGLDKFIFGSCAEGVIHHAACPVITIGPNAKESTNEVFNLDTILFATDLRHHVVEKAAAALAIAQDSVANIYMCHVLKSSHKEASEMLDERSSAGLKLRELVPASAYERCSPQCIVEFGNAAPHIIDLAKEVGADLIVLGAQREAIYLTHLFEGVIGKVLTEAQCPVMTICTN